MGRQYMGANGAQISIGKIFRFSNIYGTCVFFAARSSLYLNNSIILKNKMQRLSPWLPELTTTYKSSAIAKWTLVGEQFYLETETLSYSQQQKF